MKSLIKSKLNTNRLPKPPTGNLYHEISERAFTAHVIAMAKQFGWMVAHFRPAMTQRGRWVTAMSGDVGFPDLVMVRGGEVIFAELKSKKGRLSQDQHIWINRLNAATSGAFVWYPRDIDEIERILR